MPILPRIRPDRAVGWVVPLVLVVWLLATQGNGYLSFPYWLSFGAPVAAFLGPWVAVSAWTARSAAARPAVEARAHVAAGLAAIVVMAFLAAAVPLGLAGHSYIHAAAKVAIVGAVVSLAVAGVVVAWRIRRTPTAVEVLIVLAVAAMVEADVRMIAYGALRDFGLYLRAGHAALDGNAVYTISSAVDYTRDNTLFPFVYPPPTIPLFEALAAIPVVAARALWLALCAGASIAGLRVLGVRWRWVPVLLAWPPFVQGIYVGNAVIPTFLFFVAAPLAGWLLAFGPVFKIQLGVPGLWLVRERRWRDLAIAFAIGVALILVTLPLVGLDSWRQWVQQLADVSSLTQRDPDIMGYSLHRWLGAGTAYGLAAAAVLVSLSRRRGDSLAGLGVASLVASPTMYAHGAIMGLPALLRLRAPLLWFALAMTSTVVWQQGYWIALGLGFVALVVPRLTHEHHPDSRHHPIGELARPWPSLAEPPADRVTPDAGAGST
jgi:hypothetical protein